MRQWSRRVVEFVPGEGLMNTYVSKRPPQFGTLYDRLMGHVIPTNAALDAYVNHHHLKQLFSSEGILNIC